FELTKLPGLQLTSHISKQAEQVTIEVSEESLRRYGLTFNEVSSAIGSTSINLSAGSVETTGGNLQLRARNLANTKADFEEIIIRQTADGGIVRVSDIASVIDGFDDAKFNSTYKGLPAAVFQVLSTDTMNITESGNAIREFKEEINRTLPSNLEFDIWFDGSTMFDSRMSLIGGNAFSGMILVLITLMLFLRPKVAIWVTIGIGAAFAGSLAIAGAIGISFNMISLFAFLLVIGIVVDDAIVVGESVYFHTENGVLGETGAISGANMVVKPVFFAVITTIMMFIPFLFLSGPFGSIFGQISLVVIAVLSFSLIEAFFILPAHLRHLDPIDENKSNLLSRVQQRLANSLVNFARNVFRPIVANVIRFRYVTLASFVGLMIMAVSLLAAGIAPRAFFPEVDGDMIQVQMRFPEGTTFERSEQARAQLDEGVALLNANAQADFGIDAGVDLIANPGTSSESRQVQGFLGLTEVKNRNNASTKTITEKLEEYVGPVPDALRVTYGFAQGGGENGGRLFFGVSSTDEVALRTAVLELKSEIETYNGVTSAWDSFESSAREIQFNMKPGAETLGITLNDVTTQVRQAFFGLEVQRLPRNGEDVRVMVRYPTQARESIDSLETLFIRSANGIEVPLFSVADVTFAPGVGRIQRRDRKQVNYTGARVAGTPQALADIRKDLEDNYFPDWELRHPAVSRLNVGDDELLTTFQSEITLSLYVVLFFMYVLLAIAFRSYALPLLIMVAIPFAFIGMIFGNIITGVPFGIFSIFGFFAASGVAVNDNLVLIDYVNRLRDKGVGAYQAMLDACVARFRPILLTSVTTFVGITPILFENSAQAEFLKPMVVALAFGVLFDFFLTLILVPAMYGIGVDITRIFRSMWTGVVQPGLGSTYDPEMALALEGLEADEIKAENMPIGSTPQPAE
ncbi:MAG: efflux RND transporter permease subunit, partial [Litorimonas sp.]